MKRFFKSFICLILVLVSVLSLVSCNKKVSEEKALALVKEFLEESYELNEIYYGKGIEYQKSEDGEYASVYSPVVRNQPYVTENILRAKTEDVFSASYANAIINYHFSMTQGLVGGGNYPRYFTGSDGFLTVYRDYKVIDITEYDYSTIKIKKIKRKEIKATVVSTEKEVVDVILVLEKNGWRLDSVTA